MKAIKNIDCLDHTLNPEWQQIVYDQIGVIIILRKGCGTLFNDCGYIDLDRNAEYSSKDGVNCTDYCEIHSIDKLHQKYGVV